MEGVAGGELRGGRQLREVWGFGLRWFPDAAEGLGGSARSRGVGWWCWMDGGWPARGERSRSMVAAEPARDGEEGLPPSLAGRGVH